MFLNEFNQSPEKRIKKLNALLEKEFGVSVKSFPSKTKLEGLLETANNVLINLRNSNKKFQLDPEYAKFLGIRDVAQTMLSEGRYAESQRFQEMKNTLESTVRDLMDSGYTMEDACNECMMRFRMNPEFGHADEDVKPIIMMAAKKYMEECGSGGAMYNSALPQTDINDTLLKELAKEVGQELETLENYDAIEEKINTFAEVSGKTRDAVVGFLNGLDEEDLSAGIQMFGRKIGEQNKFTGARKDAIDKGEDEFEVDGKKYKVTGDTSDEKKQAKESMFDFDDIIEEIINEEVNVEEAEVVMAVRALSDDIQDQIERLGRMMNEDIPAIADQMRAEMGASQAQSFVDATNNLLASHLEATKSVKSGLDQSVASLSGEQMAGGLGDTAMEPSMDTDDDLESGLGLDTEEPVDNIPAASGPEDEPMGRAEV